MFAAGCGSKRSSLRVSDHRSGCETMRSEATDSVLRVRTGPCCLCANEAEADG